MVIETDAIRLDKSKVCLSCGANSSRKYINKDHAIPQAFLGMKSSRKAAKDNPLFPVVYQVSNTFPFCIDEHALIDGPKLAAFFGVKLHKLDHYERLALIKDPERGYPQNLIAWLADNYPITTLPRLRTPQIQRLQIVMDTFIAVASRGDIFPDFSDSYRKKLQLAVVEAQAFNRKLRGMEEPRTIVDLSVVSNVQ